MKKALLYVLLMVVIQLVVGFAVSVLVRMFGASYDDGLLLSIVASTIAISVLVVLLFGLMRWCPMSGDPAFVRQCPWRVWLWTVLLSLAMLAPLSWLEELIPESLRGNLLSDALEALVHSPWGFVAIVLCAPLSEEVVFRGAVIPALLEWKKASVWMAIFISAILFALVHFNPAQIPHAILVGVLLGWLFVRTRSIIPGLVLHCINNGMTYVMTWWRPDLKMDDDLLTLFSGDTQMMYGTIMVSVAVMCLALWQLHRMLPKPEALWGENGKLHGEESHS